MATRMVKPHCVMLSDTVIETDPRVRKFAQTLFDADWRVTTLGLNVNAKANKPLPWDHIAITPEAAAPIQKGRMFPSLLEKAASLKSRRKSLWGRALYYGWLRFGLRMFPGRFGAVYWASDARYQQFLDAALATTEPVNLWIANDWNMLPIAIACAEKKGGKVLYDSHEYAVEQHAANAEWVRYKQPLVKAVEANCIRRVDAVSSVSPGLCAALQARYDLAQMPTCIRNIPPFLACTLRPSSGKITVLYQGVVGPGRALKDIIRSTALWRDDFSLVIRGPEGQSGYIETLLVLIDTVKPNISIKIEAPVAANQLIHAAHQADIGLMLLPDRTIHNRFALPNKVFEYMMAGLALCVSNNPDMADLVDHYNNGVKVNDLSAITIANAIHSFDTKTINAKKQASLTAVKTLNWEQERHILLPLCAKLLLS